MECLSPLFHGGNEKAPPCGAGPKFRDECLGYAGRGTEVPRNCRWRHPDARSSLLWSRPTANARGGQPRRDSIRRDRFHEVQSLERLLASRGTVEKRKFSHGQSAGSEFIQIVLDLADLEELQL
jgi:hypothetical protein